MLTIGDFERTHRVRLQPKSVLWWARVIGWFWPGFITNWWTTIRFPFCKGVVAYPSGINPMLQMYLPTREHELVHVRQQRTAWGLFSSFLLYFFVPLPFLLSGRWFIERPAYLQDILGGHKTIDYSVKVLWRSYLWVWPRSWMKAWFTAQVQIKKHWRDV